MATQPDLPVLYGPGFKNKPKPAEVQLLVFPYRSVGDNLLRLYLQDLCLRQVLAVEYRMVLLNRRDKRKHRRLHFIHGRNFAERDIVSIAENMLLEPLLTDDEMRFYKLRQHIVRRLNKDLNEFKTQYVYTDAKRKGLIRLRYFPTSKGERSAKDVRAKIDHIEANIDHLISNDRKTLLLLLEELKNNVCLLPAEVLIKLRSLDFDDLDLAELKFLSTFSSLTNAFDFIVYIGYADFLGAGVFESGLPNIGGFGGGGFGGGGSGGFGGGSFGGGGAGGSW